MAHKTYNALSLAEINRRKTQAEADRLKASSINEQAAIYLSEMRAFGVSPLARKSWKDKIANGNYAAKLALYKFDTEKIVEKSTQILQVGVSLAKARQERTISKGDTASVEAEIASVNAQTREVSLDNKALALLAQATGLDLENEGYAFVSWTGNPGQIVNQTQLDNLLAKPPTRRNSKGETIECSLTIKPLNDLIVTPF
jgi:hypothetical protein